MKKYLITSAAALALCGLITSCSHDIDGLTPEESVAATYEKAFITAFGQPAPDQTWGFGPSVATSRAMTRGSMPSKPSFRDGTGGVPTITEPTEPTFDLSTFVDKTGEQFNVTTRGKYKVNSGSTIGELNNNGCDLYVVSDMTLSTFSAHGTNIIVAAGKKLTLKGINQNVNFYLEEGAELIADQVNSFIFDNNNTAGNTANLYMSKSSKFKGIDITFKNGYKVLNEGGTITTTNLTIYDSNTSPSTLWNNGGVTVTGNLSCENQNAYVYNGNNHTISVGGKLRLINNYDLVYNNGTIDITGDIYMENTSAEIINNDSLLCAGDFDMKAGGAFHNVGNADISGTTYIYNTNSKWMNDGHYKTGYFEDKNCNQVYNNCHMIVTENFSLGGAGKNGHADFVMEGGEGVDISGAYVSAKSFTFGDDADLWLGNKSFIEVTNSFLTTNDDKPWGIHGPSSGSYAVIKAASFTKQGNPYISMTYYGKLYIDTPTHYPKGTDNANPYYEVNDEWVKFSFEDSNIPVSIPTTNCNPGYNTEPTGDVVRVVAEDLTATTGTDFDFNDVVFDVKLRDNDRVYIYLRAAGGTLPLYIGEGSEVREVHELFGQDTNMMINTGGSYANCIDGLAPVGFSLPNPLKGKAGADDVKQVAKAIKLQVRKNVKGVSTLCELTAVEGQAPAKLCVGTDFKYTDPNNGKEYPCLTERTGIKGQFKYMPENNHPHKGEGKFLLYVQGIFGDNWYQSDAEPLPKSNN